MIASAKRQNLPFAVKLDIINRVERGEKSDIASAHKIPRSILTTILKNKAEIRAKVDAYTRLCIKMLMHPWTSGSSMSGPMIDQKVKDMAFLLAGEDVRGGSGSLQRFKGRHEIVGRAVTSESKAVDLTVWVNGWKQIGQILQQDMNETHIFDTDETALFWQMLLKKALACRATNLTAAKLTRLVYPRCWQPIWTNQKKKKSSAPSYRQKQAAAVPSECTIASSDLQIKHKSTDDWGASRCHRGMTIW